MEIKESKKLFFFLIGTMLYQSSYHIHRWQFVTKRYLRDWIFKLFINYFSTSALLLWFSSGVLTSDLTCFGNVCKEVIRVWQFLLQKDYFISSKLNFSNKNLWNSKVRGCEVSSRLAECFKAFTMEECNGFKRSRLSGIKSQNRWSVRISSTPTVDVFGNRESQFANKSICSVSLTEKTK